MYDDNGGIIHDDYIEEKDTGHDVRSVGVQASQPEPDLIEKLIELVSRTITNAMFYVFLDFIMFRPDAFMFDIFHQLYCI